MSKHSINSPIGRHKRRRPLRLTALNHASPPLDPLLDPVLLCVPPRPDTGALRSSLVAEANTVELFRDEPEDDLGLRIVGGKDTPLGNIVIQEIVRDSLAARDGRLAPGDHILEVRGSLAHSLTHSHSLILTRSFSL